jgi:hypothetical protein
MGGAERTAGGRGRAKEGESLVEVDDDALAAGCSVVALDGRDEGAPDASAAGGDDKEIVGSERSDPALMPEATCSRVVGGSASVLRKNAATPTAIPAKTASTMNNGARPGLLRPTCSSPVVID